MRTRFHFLAMTVFVFVSCSPVVPPGPPAEEMGGYPVELKTMGTHSACVVKLPDSPNAFDMGSLSGLRFDAKRKVIWSNVDNRTGSNNKLKIFQFAEVANSEASADCPRTLKYREMYILKDSAGADLTSDQYDPEAVDVATDGTLWISEEKHNDVLKIQLTENNELRVMEVLHAPMRFVDQAQGFEGLTLSRRSDGSHKYMFLAQQTRVAADVTKPNISYILRYNFENQKWAWWTYTLDALEPAVLMQQFGIHDLLWESADGSGDSLLVIERDNKTGADARTKKIQRVVVNAADTVEGDQGPIGKVTVTDLLKDYGYPHEKPEGLSMNGAGDRYMVVNDSIQMGPEEVWMYSK
jgi:hypothetical protein